MIERPLHILIGAGGTGGHLFPGIAIAQAFTLRNPSNKILFVNAGKPIDISVLSKTIYELKIIKTEGIKGRGIWQKIKAILKIPTGAFESIKTIKMFEPDLVIGMGGYASGTLVFGAWLLGIRTILHEQNILPGMTNRILSTFAHRIYVSFEETKAFSRSDKVMVTGNPIRREILEYARHNDQQDSADQTDSSDKPFTVLILGGSQGAHSINMTIIDALKYIDGKEKFFFIHQTGSMDEKTVKDAYTVNGVSGVVKPFFTDIPEQYGKADLIICRAGATTVAEVTAMGKAVIFIPYPFAADDHQALNARALFRTGAAEMILDNELSGKKLADRINHYQSDREGLEQMGIKSKKFGKPNAADDIVENCYKLIEEAI